MRDGITDQQSVETAADSSGLVEIAKVLRIIERDLKNVLVPELSSASSKALAALISGLLTGLAGELLVEHDRAEQHDRMIRSARAIAEAIRSVRAQEAPPAATVLEDRLARSPLNPGSLLESMEEATRCIANVDSNAMAPQLMGELWRTMLSHIEAQQRRVLGGETISWDTSYKESGSGRLAGRKAGGFDVTRMSVDRLQQYISEALPASRGTIVHSVDQVPGGWSKSTFIATMTSPDRRNEQWVLRCDLPYSVLRSSVSAEFGVISGLHSAGIPVPKPLWCEPSPAIFGTAVMAVSKLPGSADVSAWAEDPKRALTVGTAAATLLARVHQLAPASIGTFDTAVPGSSGNTPRLMIEHLHEFWIEKRTEALPLVELIFGWLRHNAPPSFRRSAVVHGDFAFHNLLVHQDRIEGLLDWEFCHHGDAQEDLAYTQRFVHQVMPWDDFRRAYEKAGGVESSPDELRFYSVLSHFRNALGCAGVLHALRTGSHEVDSKLVYVGRRYVHQMLTDAAKHTNAF